MPQLDFFNWGLQSLTFTVIFFLFYYFLLLIALPTVFKSLKLRHKVLNLRRVTTKFFILFGDKYSQKLLRNWYAVLAHNYSQQVNAQENALATISGDTRQATAGMRQEFSQALMNLTLTGWLLKNSSK